MGLELAESIAKVSIQEIMRSLQPIIRAFHVSQSQLAATAPDPVLTQPCDHRTLMVTPTACSIDAIQSDVNNKRGRVSIAWNDNIGVYGDNSVVTVAFQAAWIVQA